MPHINIIDLDSSSAWAYEIATTGQAAPPSDQSRLLRPLSWSWNRWPITAQTPGVAAARHLQPARLARSGAWLEDVIRPGDTCEGEPTYPSTRCLVLRRQQLEAWGNPSDTETKNGQSSWKGPAHQLCYCKIVCAVDIYGVAPRHFVAAQGLSK